MNTSLLLGRSLVAACAVLGMALAYSAAHATTCNTANTSVNPSGPCTGILASADSNRVYPQGAAFVTQEDQLTTTGNTTPIKVVGGTIAYSFDGAATSITGTVQRSVDGGVTWHLATTSSVSGNPSTFIAPVVNTEYGIAWYRVSLSAITGSPVNIAGSAQAYK